MPDDAKTPEQRDAERAAEKHRKEVEAAIMAALLFLRDRVTVAVWWLPETWTEFESQLSDAVDPAINASDEAAKAVWAGYDALDAQTVNAQRAFRDKFTQQTTGATHRATEQVVAWLAANGIAGDDADAVLARVVGVNANQADNLFGKLAAMLEEGASVAAMLQALKGMVGPMLRDRVGILSGDALWSAVELGQLHAGKQEQRATNVLVTKEWRTAMDERVCSVCGPLHGVSVSIN